MISRNKTGIFLHLVWRTFERHPMITAEIEARVHGSIQAEAQSMNCYALAVNDTTDHVHLLVDVPPTLSVSDLLKQVKGASSHLVNHEMNPSLTFRWQGSYGAFSVSKADVPRIARYIQEQKAHHRNGSTASAWEP